MQRRVFGRTFLLWHKPTHICSPFPRILNYIPNWTVKPNLILQMMDVFVLKKMLNLHRMTTSAVHVDTRERHHPLMLLDKHTQLNGSTVSETPNKAFHYITEMTQRHLPSWQWTGGMHICICSCHICTEACLYVGCSGWPTWKEKDKTNGPRSPLVCPKRKFITAECRSLTCWCSWSFSVTCW